MKINIQMQAALAFQLVFVLSSHAISQDFFLEE